ncbi:hypothetical protein V6R21_30030 [Limibacter armeniacum]|uniref:hypothetical protein n=1 Tax=Limibacter armeniacum TaxID=466084 RepID=UPI002FE65F89
MKTLWIFILGTLISAPLFAQQEAPDQDIKSFLEEIESSDVSKRLDYIDPNCKINYVLVRLNGNIGTQTYTYDDLVKRAEYNRINNLSFKTSIKSVNTHTAADASICEYTREFEIFKGEEKIAENTQVITAVLKKVNDDWKIVQMNISELEQNKEKGTCLCEVYGGPQDEYIVKAIIPAGDHYETQMDNYTLSGNDGDKVIKTAKGKYLLRNNEVFMMENEKAVKSLGNATKDEEAFLLILKQQYSQQCSNILRRQ